MAVATFYPLNDMHISTNSSSYSTAANGAGTRSLHPSSQLYVGQYLGPDYEVMQTVLDFDTSSLPDYAIIDSVTLELYGDPLSVHMSDFTLEARAFDFGTIGTEDFVSNADLVDYPLLATFNTTGWSTAGYNALVESGTALRDWINLYGSTRIILNSSRHRLGLAPTASLNREYLVFSGFRESDTPTFKDPKLTVTYSAMLVVGGGEFVGNSGFSIGTGSNCTPIFADTWRDTTLRIVLEADEFAGATNITVKMTAGGCAIGDSDEAPTEDILALYTISSLAAGEIFTIDGRRREILVENPVTFRVDGGLPRLTGSQVFRWPDIVTCQTACVCVNVTGGAVRVTIDSFAREL